MNLRKGDPIQVIAGRDKGKKGNIESVLVKENRVVVAGLNLRQRHLKPTRTNPKGGIAQFSAPIPRANLIIVCSSCNRLTRGHKIQEGDSKYRACTFCQANLDAK